MPAEFAPAAIRAVFDRVAGAQPDLEVQLGGILGDSAHTYGYHRARAVLPEDDYSTVLPRDRQGPAWAASALDITPATTEGVQLLTHRLVHACRRMDSRVKHVVREFYGTLNGTEVYGFDLHDWSPATSDASHLWHLHISFYRKYATRAVLLARVADVLNGD